MSPIKKIQTLPNHSYDIKLLNSYITNIPKHSSAQIKSVPTFFFNTQLKVPDLRKFHTNIMENSERSYVIKKLQEEIEDRENFLNEIKKEEEEKKKNIKKEKKDEISQKLKTLQEKIQEANFAKSTLTKMLVEKENIINEMCIQKKEYENNIEILNNDKNVLQKYINDLEIKQKEEKEKRIKEEKEKKRIEEENKKKEEESILNINNEKNIIKLMVYLVLEEIYL